MAKAGSARNYVEQVDAVVQAATRWARRMPIRASVLLSLVVLIAAVTGSWAAGTARWAAFALQASSPSTPQIAEYEASDVAKLHFRYKGCTRFVTVVVGKPELDAARALDTGAVFRSPWPLRAAYLRLLVAREARSASVQSVVGQLRELRNRLGLDSDEYAELIVRFVQAVPYGGIDGRVRLSAEVFAEGVAACDDRSILLAALLVHEEYDVALFAFDQQAHAAVGLRSISSGFRDTGYAFVETNRPAFIGEASGRYTAWAAWRRNPQVVPLGGRLIYSAENQASFIVATLARAHSVARQLEQYAEYARSGPVKWRAVYDEQVRRRSEAERTVALIEAHEFDREGLFEALTERAAGL